MWQQLKRLLLIEVQNKGATSLPYLIIPSYLYHTTSYLGLHWVLNSAVALCDVNTLLSSLFRSYPWLAKDHLTMQLLMWWNASNVKLYCRNLFVIKAWIEQANQLFIFLLMLNWLHLSSLWCFHYKHCHSCKTFPGAGLSVNYESNHLGTR